MFRVDLKWEVRIPALREFPPIVKKSARTDISSSGS
jgi:hypothetical protein